METCDCLWPALFDPHEGVTQTMVIGPATTPPQGGRQEGRA